MDSQALALSSWQHVTLGLALELAVGSAYLLPRRALATTPPALEPSDNASNELEIIVDRLALRVATCHRQAPRSDSPAQVNQSRPALKPCRQVAKVGVQPRARLALAFEAPWICVIIETPTSPTSGRASQTGMWKGGFAPTARASSGSQTRTGAGSSSQML